MRLQRLYYSLLYLGLLFGGPRLFAQASRDSVRFVNFSDSNYARVYSGFYHTMFSAGTGSIINGTGIHRGPRLQANSSAYLGGEIDYKWLTIAYAFNIPRTSVLGGRDRTVKAVNINVSHFWKHWGLEATYQHDRGLVDQDDLGLRTVNTVWQFVDYKYVGVNMDYFFNPNRFSYKAADNFSMLQTRSGGSWLLMVTPAYQNFALQKNARDTAVKDTLLFNLLKGNTNHLILLGKFGYTHQFVWNGGHWSLSPLACIGPGLGFYLDNLHSRQKLYPMIGYQGKLTLGYNGPKWYVYASGLYDLMQETQKNLGLKTVNEGVSLGVGYRFPSSRHRILKWL